MRIDRLRCLVIILLVGGCIEPFTPDIPSDEIGVLVVEGYINAGRGKTVIRLSSSTSVNDSEQLVNPQTKATVQIVDNYNQNFLLTEIETGIYSTGELNLPTDAQYRLDIRLENGKTYQSKLTSVKVTPPIDSITWEIQDQLNLYVNSHDASGNTRFYKFSYHEDWEIASPLKALLKWENDTIKITTLAEKVAMANCWKKADSKDLLFTSAKALQKDEIKFNILTIPIGAEKTSVKYSVIVDQHALTEEDYNYQWLMQRNTSLTGSFFDPTPSQLYGNIESLSAPDELVVGYVAAYTTEKKTLFILNSELPSVDGGFQCLTQQFRQDDQSLMNQFLGDNSLYVPYQTWIDAETRAWVLVIERQCVDCRVYGSSIKPDYWD
jgi:hypothetical protein